MTLLWKYLLLEIVCWNSWVNFRGRCSCMYSDLAVLIYKILRMKWITAFSLINLKSFTLPFVGGRHRNAGATKLPSWKNKQKTNKKSHPLAKLLCQLLSIGWNSVWYYLVVVLKMLMYSCNCTHIGCDGLGTWFVLMPVSGRASVVSVVKRRSNHGTLCQVLVFPLQLALSYS